MRNTMATLRADAGMLIMAHRGTAVGSITENTVAAVHAALRSGADMVEIDIVASTDGDFFCFHDGAESRLFGQELNIVDLSGREIRQLRYIHTDRTDRSARVASLADVLHHLPPRAVLNIDRSWRWWDTLLPWLEEWEVTHQLTLKCWAKDDSSVDTLRRQGPQLPFIPICESLDQAHAMVADPRLNTVGVELLARTPDHPALDREAISELKALRPTDEPLLVMINSEVLRDGVPLFAGHDDESAVLISPHTAWGPLFDLGVDIIQTDWPWVLRDYRAWRADHAD